MCWFVVVPLLLRKDIEGSTLHDMFFYADGNPPPSFFRMPLLLYRPPVIDFPSGAQQELGHDPNPSDMRMRDNSAGGGGGGGGDTWIRHASGVASEDLSESSRQARHAAQRGQRHENRRGAATDPEAASEGIPFAFQLDDGRLPPGGAPPLSSSLDWMGGEGLDDPEGVHKRSLNGTSKGISPAAGISAGAMSPRDEGDLIHRDSPGARPQQQVRVFRHALSPAVSEKSDRRTPRSFTLMKNDNLLECEGARRFIRCLLSAMPFRRYCSWGSSVRLLPSLCTHVPFFLRSVCRPSCLCFARAIVSKENGAAGGKIIGQLRRVRT